MCLLAACSPELDPIRLERSPAELSIVAVLSGEQVASVQRVREAGTAVQLDDGDVLLVLSVQLEQVLEPDATPAHLERIEGATVRTLAEPPAPGGCGRCALPALEGEPQLLHDGDSCPLPPLAIARAFDAGGPLSEAEATRLRAIASEQLRIDWPGACSCVAAATRAGEVAPELEVCAPALRGVTLHDQLGIGTDGTTLLVTHGSALRIDPDGRRLPLPGPPHAGAFIFDKVTPLPGWRRFLVRADERFWLLEPPEDPAWVELPFELIGMKPFAILPSAATGPLTLFGEARFSPVATPAVAACADPRSFANPPCVLERVHEAPGCEWLEHKRSASFVGGARAPDGTLAAITDRGELVVQTPAGWSCPPPIPAEGIAAGMDGRLVVEERPVREVVMARGRLFACAEARLDPSGEPRVAILTAELRAPPAPQHLSVGALLEPGLIRCGGLLVEPGGEVRVLALGVEADGVFWSLDGRGAAVARSVPPPDLRPLVRVQSSTAGWAAFERGDGAVFRRAPGGGVIERILGPPAAEGGAYRAFADAPGGVIALGRPRAAWIPDALADCAALESGVEDLPLIGLSTVAASGVSAVARDAGGDNRWLIAGEHPPGRGFAAAIDLTSREVQTPIDLRDILAHRVEALGSGAFLLVGERALYRLDVDRRSVEPLSVPDLPAGERWLTSSAAGGVVWVLGSSRLLRLAPAPSGRPPRIESLLVHQPALCEGPPSESRPCARAILASCPDRVLIALEDERSPVPERLRALAPSTECAGDPLAIPLDGAFAGMSLCVQPGFRGELVDTPRFILGSRSSLTIVSADGAFSRQGRAQVRAGASPLTAAHFSGGRLLLGTERRRLLGAVETAHP